MNAYCLLSRPQAALYQQAVRDLRERLAAADGMARRGLVLASLVRLESICNHPSQWLGDGAWSNGSRTTSACHSSSCRSRPAEAG